VNARERIEAVVHHRQPDKVPFAPLIEYVPRGEFTRALRNRGMGFMTRTRMWRVEQPNVTYETRVEDDKVFTTAHTPVGSVSRWARTHLTRAATTGRALGREGWIKEQKDYDPVLFMIEDTVYSPDYQVYDRLTREFGGDGVVRGARFDAPFWYAYRDYFGASSPDGVQNFYYHQLDHPDHFAELIKALERRNERQFPVVVNCPAELMEVGAVDGIYGPKQYETYFMPFYDQYVPLFHERKKIVFPHAHSSHLKSFVDQITRSGVDMLDAYTPPPVGDLSVAEARAIWGDEMVIALHFPESIFLQGPAATKAYTLEQLRGNAGGPLIVGMTEIGTSMIVDDPMERDFHQGMMAILDAIDEYRP
jgi:hypothetical protein